MAQGLADSLYGLADSLYDALLLTWSLLFFCSRLIVYHK